MYPKAVPNDFEGPSYAECVWVAWFASPTSFLLSIWWENNVLS